MLSIHWLYRRSCNSVIKTLGADVIATSNAMSTFNMADVNIKQHDLFMATPTLQSNVEDRNDMQEKGSIMVVRCWEKNPSLGITVWHHSAKPCDAKQCPSDRFSYPHLTLMKDSYKLSACLPLFVCLSKKMKVCCKNTNLPFRTDQLLINDSYQTQSSKSLKYLSHSFQMVSFHQLRQIRCRRIQRLIRVHTQCINLENFYTENKRNKPDTEFMGCMP